MATPNKDELILDAAIDTLIVGLIKTTARQLQLPVTVKVSKKQSATTIKIAIDRA